MDILPCFVLFISVTMVTSRYPGGNRGYGGYPDQTNGVDRLIKFGSGFQRVSNGVVAPYNNAQRQLAVNYQALIGGTGTGTGLFYGVPGTGLHFDRTPQGGNRRQGLTRSGSGYKPRRGLQQRYRYRSYRDNGNQDDRYVSRNADGLHDNTYITENKGHENNQGGHGDKEHTPIYGNNKLVFRPLDNHGYQKKLYYKTKEYGHTSRNNARYSRPIYTKAALFH